MYREYLAGHVVPEYAPAELSENFQKMLGMVRWPEDEDPSDERPESPLQRAAQRAWETLIRTLASGRVTDEMLYAQRYAEWEETLRYLGEGRLPVTPAQRDAAEFLTLLDVSSLGTAMRETPDEALATPRESSTDQPATEGA